MILHTCTFPCLHYHGGGHAFTPLPCLPSAHSCRKGPFGVILPLHFYYFVLYLQVNLRERKEERRRPAPFVALPSWTVWPGLWPVDLTTTCRRTACLPACATPCHANLIPFPTYLLPYLPDNLPTPTFPTCPLLPAPRGKGGDAYLGLCLLLL